jgi:hypothetical protein
MSQLGKRGALKIRSRAGMKTKKAALLGGGYWMSAREARSLCPVASLGGALGLVLGVVFRHFLLGFALDFLAALLDLLAGFVRLLVHFLLGAVEAVITMVVCNGSTREGSQEGGGNQGNQCFHRWFSIVVDDYRRALAATLVANLPGIVIYPISAYG